MKFLKHVLRPLKPAIATTIGAYYNIAKKNLLEQALTIFLFHDVSNNPSEFSRKYNLTTSPDIFLYQLQFIKDHFNVISPDDLLEYRIPKNAALLTFDDGFRSFFTNVIPLLNEYKVPCLILLNI